LEKRSRFLRRYELSFGPRAKGGYVLPLIANDGEVSVLAALRQALRSKKASLAQANGDSVDLIAVTYDAKLGVLVLLFHRASPNAADPAYRKITSDQMSVRQAKKENGEEQTVSAHLVIKTKSKRPGTYDAALEEMPGLSLSTIRPIIGLALNDFRYAYEDRKGNEKETYSTFKPYGLKAESLTAALKSKGSLNFLTLTRTKVPDAPDSEGIAEPQVEKIKYKIIGDPTAPEWRAKFATFVKNAREKEWDDITLDMSLEDDRHRTVKVDREAEAAEILFVRAEQIHVSEDLNPCTMKVVDALVTQATKLLAKAPPA
jgi:hypothetical protein